MRLVSLSPAAIEWIVACDAGGMIVGRSHRYGGSDLKDASVVTISESDRENQQDHFMPDRLDTPDLERIRDLRPDLVITSSPGQTQAVRHAVPDTEVLQFAPWTLGDMLKTVLHLGRAIDRAREAMSIIGQLERELADANARSGLDRRSNPRPRILVVTGAEPLTSGGYWTADLIEHAGGAPVLTSSGTAPQSISTNEIEGEDPEIIVISDPNLAGGGLDGLTTTSVIHRLPADLQVYQPTPALYRTIYYFMSLIGDG